MITIAKRNMKLFFMDKYSVFFSLLAVFIIIGLYVLFLGDVFSSDMDEFPNPAFLMNSWIMGGMLAVTAITTTMGAFGIMVEDRSNKILKDFYTSPLKRTKLAGGYIIASVAVGIIMTLVTLVLAEIFIVAKGGELLELDTMLRVLGLIVLSVVSGSSMVFFMVSFFSSNNAFATASTVLGTLIGFLTGIYVPIGSLPDGVQFVIKCFPPSYAAAMLRQNMMQKAIDVNFAGIPAQYTDSFKETMGVILKFGDHVVTTQESILILIATTVLFYGLSVINLSRKMK